MTKWLEAQERLAKIRQALRAYIVEKLKSPASDPESAGSPTPETLDSLDSIFSEIDILKQRRDDLARAEAKLQFSLEQIPSNVIPFQRPYHETSTATVAGSNKRWMLKLDCLIESPHVSEIHKLALELHHQSFRYAFIEYRDLDRSMRTQLTELLKMGAISLFVPDLLSLTATEQKVLRSLVELDTLQRPLLMAGTTTPYADLRLEPNLDMDLLALLSRAYFKLTRPFSEYKDQGLINYFLDSLS